MQACCFRFYFLLVTVIIFAGMVFNSVNLISVVLAPKFGEKSHEETLHQERSPQSNMGFGEKDSQAQECGQSYAFILLLKQG